MKTIKDQWGEAVKPYSTHMDRQGRYWTITDLAPDEEFPIGAAPEGADLEEDGDYFPASTFWFQIEDDQREEDERQEKLPFPSMEGKGR